MELARQRFENDFYDLERRLLSCIEDLRDQNVSNESFYVAIKLAVTRARAAIIKAQEMQSGSCKSPNNAFMSHFPVKQALTLSCCGCCDECCDCGNCCCCCDGGGGGVSGGGFPADLGGMHHGP